MRSEKTDRHCHRGYAAKINYPGRYSPTDHRYWQIIFDEKSRLGQHMQDVCLKGSEIARFLRQRCYINNCTENPEKLKKEIRNTPKELGIFHRKSQDEINQILNRHSDLKKFSWSRHDIDQLIDIGDKAGNIYYHDDQHGWKLTMGQTTRDAVLD